MLYVSPRPAPSSTGARWRVTALAVLLAIACGLLLHMTRARYAPGCAAYPPVRGTMLIGHAGGGLPNRTYANNLAALDAGYARGLRIFELDLHELPFGGIRTGHDWYDVLDPASAWLSDVAAWLRRHPDARLITDFKTDNARGLARLARLAPDLRGRIMPFVYTPGDYPVARALGFDKVVFASYRQRADRGWLDYVNDHDVAAVAIPYRDIGLLPLIHRPVFVHVLEAMPAQRGFAGIITDCLVPVRA